VSIQRYLMTSFVVSFVAQFLFLFLIHIFLCIIVYWFPSSMEFICVYVLCSLLGRWECIFISYSHSINILFVYQTKMCWLLIHKLCFLLGIAFIHCIFQTIFGIRMLTNKIFTEKRARDTPSNCRNISFSLKWGDLWSQEGVFVLFPSQEQLEEKHPNQHRCQGNNLQSFLPWGTTMIIFYAWWWKSTEQLENNSFKRIIFHEVFT